eukprot:gene20572-22596_t
MAAWRISKFLLNSQTKVCHICRCEISNSSKIFPLTAYGSFKKSTLPVRIANVARYYEKPKEKKGPDSKFWWAFAGATSGMLVGALIFMGRPDLENVEEDLYKNEPLPLAYIYRARDRLHEFTEVFVEPSSQNLLPDPLPEPYIQPPYTLVLEMTDIFVHPEYDRNSGWRFRKRPGVDKFLASLSAPYFELVIYTHENGFSASPVVDGLDPEGFIMYRLFRDATKYKNGTHVKDLACLNRDLSKVILLDCNAAAGSIAPRNSLVIKKWEGDPRDTTLIDLIPFFQAIAISGVEDVRDVLDFYRNEEDVVAAFKRNQDALRKQQEEQLSSMQQKAAGRWSIFGRLLHHRGVVSLCLSLEDQLDSERIADSRNNALTVRYVINRLKTSNACENAVTDPAIEDYAMYSALVIGLTAERLNRAGMNKKITCANAQQVAVQIDDLTTVLVTLIVVHNKAILLRSYAVEEVVASTWKRILVWYRRLIYALRQAGRADVLVTVRRQDSTTALITDLGNSRLVGTVCLSSYNKAFKRSDCDADSYWLIGLSNRRELKFGFTDEGHSNDCDNDGSENICENETGCLPHSRLPATSKGVLWMANVLYALDNNLRQNPLVQTQYGNVDSLAVFETWILSFTNPRSMLQTGNCCGTTTTTTTTSGCASQCATYFEICLDDIHLTEPNCRFGEVTSVNFARSSLNHDTSNSSNRQLTIASHTAWPGEFGIRITVRDNSSSHLIPKGHVIQSVSFVRSKQPSLAWHVVSFTGPVSTFQFKYRIKCGTFYYGVNCTVYCKERRDEHGHYICDSNGRRLYVTQLVQMDAALHPIGAAVMMVGLAMHVMFVLLEVGAKMDHAPRLATVCATQGGAVSIVTESLTSAVCEHLVRIPASASTFHRQENIDAIALLCSLGGIASHVRITACTSNPCKNGASCQVTSSGFVCNCMAGYTGLRCETFIDLCSTTSCENNGTCSVINGTATCHCIYPFTGMRCDQKTAVEPSYTLVVLGSTLMKNFTTPSSTVSTKTSAFSKATVFTKTTTSSAKTKSSYHRALRSTEQPKGIQTTTREIKPSSSLHEVVVAISTIERSEPPSHRISSLSSFRHQVSTFRPTECCSNSRSTDAQSDLIKNAKIWSTASQFASASYAPSTTINSQSTQVSSGDVDQKHKRQKPCDRSIAIAVSASLSIVLMILLAIILLWRKKLKKEKSLRLRNSSIVPSSSGLPGELFEPGNFKYTTFIDSRNKATTDGRGSKAVQESKQIAMQQSCLAAAKLAASSNGNSLKDNAQVAKRMGKDESVFTTSRGRKSNSDIRRGNDEIASIGNNRHSNGATVVNSRHGSIAATPSSPRSDSVSKDIEVRHESVCLEDGRSEIILPGSPESRQESLSSVATRKDSSANDGYVNYGYLSDGTSGYSSTCSSARSSANFHSKVFKSLVNTNDVFVLPIRHPSHSEAVEDHLPNCIVYTEEQL